MPKMLIPMVVAFLCNCHAYAQKDGKIEKDLNLQKKEMDISKIDRVAFQVNTKRFQSDEVKNATNRIKILQKEGAVDNNYITILRKEGFSHTSILASVRNIRVKDLTFLIVDNVEVANDAQLMLKAIPNMTAADILTAIRDLYSVSNINLFNIAFFISQDSVVRVNQTRSFNYRCDCKIRYASEVNSNRPYRTSKSQYGSSSTYYKKLYPWQCMDFWNTGFRAVILPETSRNNFLHAMKQSDYPFYDGLWSADLADPAIDFKVIMGNTADDLVELMESTTLDYLPIGGGCQYEYPSQTSVSLSGDTYYNGTCKFASIIKTRYKLKEILPVLKQNGYSMTVLATAAKNRFGTPDDDMKQKILASFEINVFSAAEILQVSNVLNSN